MGAQGDGLLQARGEQVVIRFLGGHTGNKQCIFWLIFDIFPYFIIHMGIVQFSSVIFGIFYVL